MQTLTHEPAAPRLWVCGAGRALVWDLQVTLVQQGSCNLSRSIQVGHHSFTFQGGG